MADLIKEIVLNVLIGDWDFAKKNDIADFFTFVILCLCLLFIIKFFIWIVGAGRRIGGGKYGGF